jgi:hypothetical protein
MEVQKALLLWVEPPDLRRATPELALTASRLDECVAVGGRQRAVLKLTVLMALPVVAFTLLDGCDEKTAGVARSNPVTGTLDEIPEEPTERERQGGEVDRLETAAVHCVER